MPLILTIEDAPVAQREPERRFDAGELSIGRGESADWRLEDPEMFISRHHCIVSGRDGEYTVTDSSRYGLYVDDDPSPVGQGREVALRNGASLRMGDFVIRARIVSEEAEHDVQRGRAGPFVDDVFGPPPRVAEENCDVFGDAPPGPPPFATRPDELDARPGARPLRPAEDDDPFALDPPPSPSREHAPGRQAQPGFDDDWWDGEASSREAPAPGPGARADAEDDWLASREAQAPSRERSLESEKDWLAPGEERTTSAHRTRGTEDDWLTGATGQAAEAPGGTPAIAPADADFRPAGPAGTAPARDARSPTGPAPRGADGEAHAALAAFLRGCGAETDAPSPDPLVELEQHGRRFHALVVGLHQLLRSRALEKRQARLAQTVIGHSEVNPLKFAATSEEAVASLLRHRGPGYLDPDEAVAAAWRDLAQHQAATWAGIQTALRRMIDRFDPGALERELEQVPTLDRLFSGGRRAKLWEIYGRRYREIAKNAEDRFMGDAGADFRDAYERLSGERDA
ncbi:MAG TPA: type VI secretion system-associated FHA domain protein TagH [Thermohalobaculum sp.]|nr:type VI secretion system-associated FHA domain protein TagH [Thermohalobaculum sp.]